MAGDLKSSLTDLQVRRYEALYSDFDRGRLERLVLANASSSNMTKHDEGEALGQLHCTCQGGKVM